MDENADEGTYQEWPSLLDGAVVWTRTAGRAGAHRVLPDGCMDVIWSEDGLIVAGPDTQAHLAPGHPPRLYAGLRFAPGTAPALLGVPAYELRDLRTPLSALWPQARVRRLAEQIATAPDPARALESGALRHLPGTPAPRRAPSPPPAVIVAAVRHGSPVPAIADSVGLSERQLHRRCLDAFGYGPKTLARVLRMNRALGLARSGLRLADVAARAGYADQAHLTREVRALTGVPPGALVAPVS